MKASTPEKLIKTIKTKTKTETERTLRITEMMIIIIDCEIYLRWKCIFKINVFSMNLERCYWKGKVMGEKFIRNYVGLLS